MAEFPKTLKFKYTWRKYQQRVLEDLRNHLAEKSIKRIFERHRWDAAANRVRGNKEDALKELAPLCGIENKLHFMRRGTPLQPRSRYPTEFPLRR